MTSIVSSRARRPMTRGRVAAHVVPADVAVGGVSVGSVSAGQVAMAALASLGLGAGVFLVTGNSLATLGGLVAGAAIGASLHSETAVA